MPKTEQRVWKSVSSDLLVNLSAGWLGAALIVPSFSGETLQVNFLLLTGDLLMGILCLGLAFLIRKKTI